jgi:hypothetical protein
MTGPCGPILASGQQISDADLVEKKKGKKGVSENVGIPMRRTCGWHLMPRRMPRHEANAQRAVWLLKIYPHCP